MDTSKAVLDRSALHELVAAMSLGSPHHRLVHSSTGKHKISFDRLNDQRIIQCIACRLTNAVVFCHPKESLIDELIEVVVIRVLPA